MYRSAATRIEALVARFFGSLSSQDDHDGVHGWEADYDRVVRFLETAAPRTSRSGSPSLLDRLSVARRKLCIIAAQRQDDEKDASAVSSLSPSAAAALASAAAAVAPLAAAAIAPVLVALQDLNTALSSDSSMCAELVNSGEALFCTLTSSGQSMMMRACRERRIDLLVVDEAGQALEPELLIALGCLPRSLVLVGDPRQLPAMVQSHTAKRLGYGRSMMERLIDGCDAPNHLLDTQCVRPSLHPPLV